MDTPQLELTAEGTPRSARYDDVYFSREDGLAESRYVFLTHNRLPDRFGKLKEHQVFSIAETGFGTGLNFLAAWQLFDQLAPTNARLVFVSTEKYPLAPGDIAASLEHWPELAPYLERLLAAYPPRIEGFHCVELTPQVELLLLFGDANDTLADLNARIDAWFLDGFAPAKNPELWQPSLFQAMSRLSHQDTTAATFTAARLVRDGLSGAGFQVERVKGYGSKRAMVQARFIGRCGPPEPGTWPGNEYAWPRPPDIKTATVVGAGLAGAHTARELAERGWRVTVLEQADAVAAGASGNAQGAVYARLSHERSASNAFYTQALSLAQHRLTQLPQAVPHDACGLLQLNQGAKEAKRFEHFLSRNPFPEEFVQCLNAKQAETRAGVPVATEALYFPGGGWVSPAELVAHRLDHPNIEVRLSHRVSQLTPLASGWQIDAETPDGTKSFSSTTLILTTAWESTNLPQTAYLPARPITGQVTRIASEGVVAGLKAVLCYRNTKANTAWEPPSTSRKPSPNAARRTTPTTSPPCTNAYPKW